MNISSLMFLVKIDIIYYASSFLLLSVTSTSQTYFYHNYWRYGFIEKILEAATGGVLKKRFFATLLWRRLQRRYFSVNFIKFLRTPFLQNTSRQLLLKFYLPTTEVSLEPYQVSSMDLFFVNSWKFSAVISFF